MELSKEELQYILSAIDTHVRTNGLNVASVGLSVASKLQTAAAAGTSVEVPDADTTPDAGDRGAS